MLILMSTACTSSESDSDTSAPVKSEPSESSDATTNPQTNLLTYDGPSQGIPVSAQYRETMEVFGTGSGEGVGVRFIFKPQGNALDDAEVSIFLPAGGSSTSDLNIDGPNGLIENNGWSLDGQRADTASEFPYPWFEMVFDISTDLEQTGHILLGESHGQAIQVIVLYPTDMSDEFWPGARIVLESLEFDAELLPITTSGL